MKLHLSRRLPALCRLTATLLAAGCISLPVSAQTVIIGDNTASVIVTVDLPLNPGPFAAVYDTLVLGNQPTGGGVLNFRSGTLSFSQIAGTQSGYAVVGNQGSGDFNQSNTVGASVVSFSGQAYSGTSGDPFGGYLVIGRLQGSMGSYMMNGGGVGTVQLNVQNDIMVGGADLGAPYSGGCGTGILACTGTFTQNAGEVNAGRIRVGVDGANGQYWLNDGVVNANITVGDTGMGTASFTQAAGTTVTQTGDSFIGLYGQGTYSQLGGVHNAAQLHLGYSGTGTYDISSSSVLNVQNFTLGSNFFGDGLLILSDEAAVTVGTASLGRLIVGDAGIGTVVMTGGTLDILNSDNSVNAFIIGNQALGDGLFWQSGGTVTSARQLLLGNDAGSIGEYILLSSGQLTAPLITVGLNGYGSFSQLGAMTMVDASSGLLIGATGSLSSPGGDYSLDQGQLTVGGLGTIVGTAGGGYFTHVDGTHTTTRLVLGDSPGAEGGYEFLSGTLNVGSDLIVGRQGGGSFLQSGGDAFADRVIIGATNASSGQYTMEAGTLSVARDLIIGADEFTNTGGAGSFVQISGVVTTGAMYMNGGYNIGNTTSVYILQSGAILNSGTFGSLSNASLFQQDGGQHTNIGLFIVGNSGGSDYDTVYRMGGGQANFQDLQVGGYGRGTMNQSAGTISVAGKLYVGAGPSLDPARRFGEYNLTGGTLVATNNIIVGAGNFSFDGQPGGLGRFHQSGGTVQVGGDLLIGQFNSRGSGRGSYRIEAGGLMVSGNMVVAQGGGTGTLVQTGGDVVVASFLTIGDDLGASGNYQLSGGSLKADNTILGGGFLGTPGAGGTGSFVQTGGSFQTGFLNMGGGGFTQKGQGSYTLSSGQLIIDNNLVMGNGVGGSAQFTQTGGSVQVNSPGFGAYVHNGTYSMSGGTLSVANTVYVGDAGIGVLNVSGGSLSAASIANKGTLNYSAGSIASDISNGPTGVVNFSGAGTRVLTGTLFNQGSVVLSGPGDAQVSSLSQQGGTVSLGANNLIVTTDYTSTGFDTGNSFNRRAGVTGAGKISAGGSAPGVAQTLAAGGPPTSGDTSIEFGSLRLGQSATAFYSIQNTTNSGGPTLRGAIQTSANGSNLTDPRLSGTGVTAGNWGPVGPGGNSGALAATFTASSSGALVNQKVAIVNNFENTNSQLLSFSAKAYTPAVAQLNTPTLNFGIVHVGDVVTNQAVSVSNTTTATALNDTLRASLSAVGSPFANNSSGSTNVAAGATDVSTLQVGLSTANAGIYSTSATLLLASSNADMSDLILTSQNVALNAQVNNYAKAGLAKTGGAGSFSGGAMSYTLNFGTLVQGMAGLSSLLAVQNLALGPADLLAGTFNLGTVGLSDNFSVSGFGGFAGIAAGDSSGGLNVNFGSGILGSFDKIIALSPVGSNASGYSGALDSVQLHLVGNVVAVPEPGTYLLMFTGLLGLALAARRRGQVLVDQAPGA